MSEFIQQSEEVFYPKPGEPVVVGPREIEFLREQARQTRRKRARLCCHANADALVHEMFIYHERGAYVAPHLHVQKSESLQVIHGAADAILFTEHGAVQSIVPVGEGGSSYYRIDSGVFHTLRIRSSEFIFKEVVQGPFQFGLANQLQNEKQEVLLKCSVISLFELHCTESVY